MTSKFASLYAGLLARKGEATPVFVNPAVSYIDTPRPDGESDGEVIRRNVASADGLPLMAEKAMADDDPAAGLTPGVQGPVVKAPSTNGSSHLHAVNGTAPRKRARKTIKREHHGPYRFSFRIPADQHRRLRVAAAQKNISLQQALSDALDKYLDGLCACSLSDCNCMARQDDARKN
jgi:hypothetical protein